MSSPEMTPPSEVPTLPPLPVAAPTPVPVVPIVKSPWVALILSLLMPGIGQVYNGQFAKALAFFMAFSGSIYLIAEGHPLPFGLFLPFIIFSNMIDAYRSAARINLRGIQALPEEDEQESPAWGISIAVMGVLILLNNLGWLRLSALIPYWPLLLIAAGLVLLRRSIQRKGVDGPTV
jgi:4-hydroxybenzoate polyprenyltransferase